MTTESENAVSVGNGRCRLQQHDTLRCVCAKDADIAADIADAKGCEVHAADDLTPHQILRLIKGRINSGQICQF